jgi:hypothetical protein
VADNVDITAGSGTTIAADEIAGVKHQRVKVEWGVDGSAVDASASNPLPIVQTGALPAGTNAIGKLAANSGVDIGDVDITSIAAGDNNIGNVDVVTLPADPLGANADASVAAGATGSISAKLRRATQGLEDLKTLIVLAAGTNAIGKLAANSGVDIGDVDVTSSGAGENHLGEMGGKLVSVSGSFTRPADTTAYAIGDVVSNSTGGTTLLSIAGCARVNQGSGYIVGARLITDKKSITPRFRVHVYNASNPTVAVDNAAMDIRYADISKRIGSFDLPAMSTGADSTNSTSSQAQDMALRVPFVCAAATTTLYFLFEALDVFTPSSGEAFTLVIYADQN